MMGKCAKRIVMCCFSVCLLLGVCLTSGCQNGGSVHLSEEEWNKLQEQLTAMEERIDMLEKENQVFKSELGLSDEVVTTSSAASTTSAAASSTKAGSTTTKKKNGGTTTTAKDANTHSTTKVTTKSTTTASTTTTTKSDDGFGSEDNFDD